MALPKRARSGGPKTAAGLAVASQNAIKTGAYAVQVVLPGEEAQEFDALKAQLQQDFAPIGLAEASMARDLKLLHYMKGNNNGTQRAFDDISRTFYRTLSNCAASKTGACGAPPSW